MTQDLPDHLRTDSEKIVVPPYYPDTPKGKIITGSLTMQHRHHGYCEAKSFSRA